MCLSMCLSFVCLVICLSSVCRSILFCCFWALCQVGLFGCSVIVSWPAVIVYVWVVGLYVCVMGCVGVGWFMFGCWFVGFGGWLCSLLLARCGVLVFGLVYVFGVVGWGGSCCSCLRFSALMKSCTICREFSLRSLSLLCFILSWLYRAKPKASDTSMVIAQSCMVMGLLSHILFGFSTQNTRWVAGMVFLLRISRFVALCLRSCCCTHFY